MAVDEIVVPIRGRARNERTTTHVVASARATLLAASVIASTGSRYSVAAAEPTPISAATPTPGVTRADDFENMRAEYRRLDGELSAATAVDPAVLRALHRRIAWGLDGLADDVTTTKPELAPEKAQQLDFDRAVVDEALANVSLPIVETAGAHEAVPTGDGFVEDWPLW